MKNKIVLNSNLKWLLIITTLSTLIFIMLTVILIMVNIIFKGLNNVRKFDYKWYWKLALYFIVSCGLLFVIMYTILLINLILLTNSLKKNNNVIPSKNENILKIINFIIISFTFFLILFIETNI